MKVSDADILKAIWREQVKRTARGVIENYVGERKGLRSESSKRYSQALYMIGRAGLNVPLSKGHLGKRLKQLIGTVEGLEWFGRPGNSYQFVGERPDEVFTYAWHWWSARGVPDGYEPGKGCRCVKVENFDQLAADLELELVGKFC